MVAPGEVKYIGNTWTKKFHRPDCKWAKQISPQNRVDFRTREEAIRQGYEPCKVCRHLTFPGNCLDGKRAFSGRRWHGVDKLAGGERSN